MSVVPNVNLTLFTATPPDYPKIVVKAVQPGLKGNLIGLSVTYVDTIQNFSVTRPTLTGGTYSVQNDVEVQNVTSATFREEVLIVPDADTTGASGAWEPIANPALSPSQVPTRIPRVKPTFFGAYRDTGVLSDYRRNFQLVQAAVRAAERFGMVVDIDRAYKVYHHIRMPSGIVVEGTHEDSAIVSVNDMADDYRSAVLLGSWHPKFYPNKSSDDPFYRQFVEWLDFTFLSDGRVQLTKPWKIAGIQPGSTVLVRDSRYYHTGRGQSPFYCVPNARRGDGAGENPGQGIIALEYLIGAEIEGPQIALATNPLSLVTDPVTSEVPASRFFAGQVLPDWFGQLAKRYGEPMSVLRDFRMYGVKLESRGGYVDPPPGFQGHPICGNGATLNCDIDIPETEGRTGAYLSAPGYSRFHFGRIKAWEKAIEIVNGGSSVLTVGDIEWTSLPDHTDAYSIIHFNENVRDIDVNIGSVRINGMIRLPDPPGGPRRTASIVAVRACQDVTCRIGTLTAPEWAGRIVAVTSEEGDPDADTPARPVENVAVTIGSATGGTPTADKLDWYVSMDNGGGTLRDVRVRGNFGGPVHSGAVLLDGRNVSFSGRIGEGVVSAKSSSDRFFGPGPFGSIAIADQRAEGAPLGVSLTATSNGGLAGPETYANIVSGGAGVARAYQPDLSSPVAGGIRRHRVRFANATEFTVQNPINARAGDIFVLTLINGNSGTDITPSFGSAYRIDAVPAIPKGELAGNYCFEVVNAAELRPANVAPA